MDTFMDKLAQKLTAQEIIKANAAADAEELNRLQNQVQEYNECLAQMRLVNEQMQETSRQMGRMMDEEIIPRMNLLVKEQVAPGVDRLLEERIVPKLHALSEETLGRMDSMQADREQAARLVEEAMGKLEQMLQGQEANESLRNSLVQLFAQSDEYVHKENVKVYRNVQAVVVEESAKQKEVLDKVLKAVTGRLNLVLGIAIGALAAGAGGLVFQILTYFHVI